MTHTDHDPSIAVPDTSARTIRNPVLAGFHPDPSILRVGEDFYLATSTFEWYPGVLLYHSRDLVDWRPLGGALTHTRLVDLAGARDSGGVWAPCLSYADGLFYIVYTNVETYAGGFWDTPNYITTASEVTGPWSDPVAVHAAGFDPSLYHEDGRTWLLTSYMDWRPGRTSAFAGIAVQELARSDLSPTGEPELVFTGTDAGVTEAPHLYRIGDWYYLMTAEGGTTWDHQVTVARSRHVTGPYEPDPAGPMLHSRDRPDLVLQKAGHASLVDTPGGEWYIAHLASRPREPRGRCVLGRETAVQAVRWSADGWPRVEGALPRVDVPAPDLAVHPWPERPATDHFDGPMLDAQWSTLRRPSSTEWLSLTDRPGHLRIRGGQSPSGRMTPSLVARRVQHHDCTFQAKVEFDPAGFQHMAGITAYYNTRQWHYLRLGRDGSGGARFAGVLSCDRGAVTEVGARIDVHDWPTVHMRADIDGGLLRFSASPDGADWHPVGTALDATILSDDYAWEEDSGAVAAFGFTGAFLGLWVHDLTGGGRPADFDYARYEGRDPEEG